MGQNTYSNAGVSVSYKVCYENIDLIYKLVTKYSDRLKIYVSYLDSIYHKDEILDYSSIYKYSDYPMQLNILEQLKNTKNPEEFCFIYQKFTDKHDIMFYFHYPCCSSYARNISRRDIPHIFSIDNEISLDNIIDSFSKGKQLFLDLGISPDKIKYGFDFYESF